MPKMKLLDSTVLDPFCKFAIKYCSIIFNGDIFDQSIYFFDSKYHMLYVYHGDYVQIIPRTNMNITVLERLTEPACFQK